MLSRGQEAVLASSSWCLSRCYAQAWHLQCNLSEDEAAWGHGSTVEVLRRPASCKSPPSQVQWQHVHCCRRALRLPPLSMESPDQEACRRSPGMMTQPRQQINPVPHHGHTVRCLCTRLCRPTSGKDACLSLVLCVASSSSCATAKPPLRPDLIGTTRDITISPSSCSLARPGTTRSVAK